jgi:phosphoribosylamine---glycine ligase
MKIAMSSYSGMGAWWCLRLAAEGHDVDYYLSKPEYEDVLKGLIKTPIKTEIDQRRHLLGYGYPSYKKYDLSLFDLTGRAKQADSSRMDCPTLGDGSLEHMLEDDREFGIKSMEGCGINVPPYERFNTPSEAKSFLKRNDRAYVYKPFTIGGTTQDTATTYVSKSAEDLLQYIDSLFEASKHAPFILQEFIKGTEIGTEAFFNGTDFYLITGTLEEKKFMNENKGPNTGCSGNLIFAMTDEFKIFKEGLFKAKEFLSSAGFRGIIDLNTIVTEDKVYGLEWTPRFGYLCCPTIATMYGNGYGELLADIATGKSPSIRWSGSFGAGITLSIPPYPTEIRLPKAKGVPIQGIDPRNLEQLVETYLYDAMLVGKNKLETSGNYGYIGAVMASGHSIEAAFKQVEHRLKGIQIPNCQIRTDIEKTTTEKYNQLQEWGWLST